MYLTRGLPLIALLLVAACGGNKSDVAGTIDAGPSSDATIRTIDLLGTFVLAGDTLTIEDAKQNFDFGAGEVSATENVVFVREPTP